jgi:glyoxylase-like metal-dependent hydrolase (beta-lactamase superfamily II)
MIEVVRIPALQDNYIWMAHDPDSGETVVIDPAEAAPVLAEADRRGWTIGRECRDQGGDRRQSDRARGRSREDRNAGCRGGRG